MAEQKHRVPLCPKVERPTSEAVGAHRREPTGYPGTTANDDDVEENTIELSLTPEYVRALSQAAAGEYPDALPRAAPANSHPPICIAEVEPRRTIEFGLWPLMAAASSVLGIAVGIALGFALHAVPPPVEIAISTPPPATLPTESAEPTVHFRNPFDPSEMFEFAPGTSRDEARQSVAAVLLQRARDRRDTVGTAVERARVAQTSDSPVANP